MGLLKYGLLAIPLVGPAMLARVNDAEAGSIGNSAEHEVSYRGGRDDEDEGYTDPYEAQQQGKKQVYTHRGFKLRSLDGSRPEKVMAAIDRALEDEVLAPQFRRHVREIDYAKDLRHPDGSSPTGFAGRGNAAYGGVISLRTENPGIVKTIAHEVGHYVTGDDEDGAESFAHSTGVMQ